MAWRPQKSWDFQILCVLQEYHKIKGKPQDGMGVVTIPVFILLDGSELSLPCSSSPHSQHPQLRKRPQLHQGRFGSDFGGNFLMERDAQP